MRLGPRAIGSAIALVRLAKLHDRSSADTICRILEFTKREHRGEGRWFHMGMDDCALSADTNFGAMVVKNLEGLAFVSIL